MSPRRHRPCRTTRNGTDVSSGRTTCAMCSSTAGHRSPGRGIAMRCSPLCAGGPSPPWRRSHAGYSSRPRAVAEPEARSSRSSPGIRQPLDHSTPTGHAANGAASALAHAECMRSHNVPDFPDPGPISIDIRAHPDLDPNSPTFVAAQHACLSLAPGGAQAARSVHSSRRPRWPTPRACDRTAFRSLPIRFLTIAGSTSRSMASTRTRHSSAAATRPVRHRQDWPL